MFAHNPSSSAASPPNSSSAKILACLNDTWPAATACPIAAKIGFGVCPDGKHMRNLGFMRRRSRQKLATPFTQDFSESNLSTFITLAEPQIDGFLHFGRE